MSTENPYIVTATGKRFHVLNPTAPEIDPFDIAFALSNICRFTGHVDFYSVAQHSLLVRDLVKLKGGSPVDQLWALLHDSAEAYISDLNSPVKRTWGLSAYRELENRLLKAIGQRFLGDVEYPPDIVMDMDFEAFKIEVNFLFSRGIREQDFRIRDSDIMAPAPPLHLDEIGQTREEFMSVYAELQKQADYWPAG